MTTVAALAAALAWLSLHSARATATARLNARPHRAGASAGSAPPAATPWWGRRSLLTRRRREVVQIADDVAAELRAGASWQQALARVAEAGELGRVLRTSTDPDHALASLGQLPGAEGLCSLHAVGRLVSQLGCPAAALADEVAEALRADDLSRRAVTVEMAAAIATARLLAVLPLVGLLMAATLGSRPLDVLTRTPAGRGCALTALLLEAAGIAWCRAIRIRAERG